MTQTMPVDIGDAVSPATFASAVYARLRDDIIAGRFPPGEKLRVRHVCARYAVGLAPAREALNRLAAEGFVRQSDHKGFAVALISREDLDDLTDSRIALAGIVLRQSVEHGDEAWEEATLLAFHRMERVSRFRTIAPPAPNPEWDRLHRAFHGALFAGCPSLRLKLYCAHLCEQADRYRTLAGLVAARWTQARIGEEHKEILDACLARKATEAVTLLAEHFSRTRTILAAHWDELMARLYAPRAG